MGIIDRSLNYGRHHITDFARIDKPAIALDLGAGKGDDLLAVASVNPGVQLHAAECYPPNVAKLRSHGIAVHAINIERDSLPFGGESLDMVIASLVLEFCFVVWWFLF